MSDCVVCGAVDAKPYPRVAWREGGFQSVSDGSPTCSPECTALDSLNQIFDKEHNAEPFAPMPDLETQREYHNWLMTRRRCDRLGLPVPPIPKTPTDRLVEEQLMTAKLKWGFEP